MCNGQVIFVELLKTKPYAISQILFDRQTSYLVPSYIIKKDVHNLIDLEQRQNTFSGIFCLLKPDHVVRLKVNGHVNKTIYAK